MESSRPAASKPLDLMGFKTAGVWQRESSTAPTLGCLLLGYCSLALERLVIIDGHVSLSAAFYKMEGSFRRKSESMDRGLDWNTEDLNSKASVLTHQLYDTGKITSF